MGSVPATAAGRTSNLSSPPPRRTAEVLRKGNIKHPLHLFSSTGLKKGLVPPSAMCPWRKPAQPVPGEGAQRDTAGTSRRGVSLWAQKAPPRCHPWSYLHPWTGPSEPAMLNIHKSLQRDRWSLELLLQRPSKCFMSSSISWLSPLDQLPSILGSCRSHLQTSQLAQ